MDPEFERIVIEEAALQAEQRKREHHPNHPFRVLLASVLIAIVIIVVLFLTM